LLLTPFQIGAMFWSWLEGESLFLAIDMEFDFSGSDINVCICSAQEGSPKDEGCLHVLLHVKYYKIHRNKEVSYFYQNIFGDSYRVADRLVS
jgi:peptide deformylase